MRIALQSPQPVELSFRVPVTIGLHDVAVTVEARWRGDDLLIRQILHNQSDASVSFTAFCQAPGRSRLDREFLDIPAGAFGTQSYLFSQARGLAGANIYMGVQEIRGRRGLEQLYKVPGP